jgi:spermidine synthase
VNRLEAEKRQPAPSLAARFLLACVALQGAFALAYEILWTRVFLQYLGNTTFAFATMLGAFLVGLACGSAIYTRWLKAVTNRVLLFFWLFLLSGISILATAPFYDVLFYLFDPIYTSVGNQWGLLSLLLFLAVAATIFVPTALSGAVLPAALGILAPEERSVGSGVGRLLFWNTFGAIAGSIAGGFLLIPHFGLLNSFRMVATANVLAAFIYLARNHAQIGMKPLRQGLALMAIVLPCWLMSWNQLLINSGTYVYSQLFEHSGGMAQYFASQRLLHLEEGSETTVVLVEHVEEGTLSIKVNGKVDGSNGKNDMQTQVLAGQLPALVHENPKDVLVIGLGTGITLAQLAQHPDLVIDCLEISPEVIATAKVFDPENISLLNNPKVNLVVEDGRNWLLTRPKQYDLIVSEPSNPWQSGNANLFTHEFYQLVKQRLAPGGIFCQWIPLYDLPPKYVNVALRTLLETFPHLRAFIVNQSEMIILSTETPIPWDADRVNQHLENEQVAASLKLLDVENAIDLAKKYYFCDEWPLKALANEAALNSDGHPILEFTRHAVRLDWDLINMQQLLQVRAAYQAFRAQRASSPPQ